MKKFNIEQSIDYFQKNKVKTPCFIFDKETINEQYNELKIEFNNILPSSVIYTLKTNPNPIIAKHLLTLGASFLVSSFEEYKLLNSINVPSKKIIYLEPSLDAEKIDNLIKTGLNTFIIDSKEQYKKISDTTEKYNNLIINALVRVNTGTVVGNNNYESISMLGTPIEESLELIKEIVTNKNFNYLGIHNHLVSQNTNLELWEKNIKSLSEFVLDLKINHNIRSKILDIGGGYPIKYHSPQNVPTIQEIIKKIQKHFTKLDCQLYIESGRYIMGPAAILISKIETIKIYRGKKVMIIDSSVYSSSMDTLVVGLLLNCLNISKENSQKMCEYIIRGQTPCSLDIFRRKVILPEVKEGDFIVFINAGAYNYSSDFTLVNKAQEYVI